jgi:hypothetical protein
MTRLRAGHPGLDSRQGRRRDFFFVATASNPAQGHTHGPFQCVPEALSPGVKLIIHLRLVTRLRMREDIPFTTTIRPHGSCAVKHRDSVTFTFVYCLTKVMKLIFYEVSLQVEGLLGLILCSGVEGYQRFGEPCCLQRFG